MGKDAYELFGKLDLGDIIGVKGNVLEPGWGKSPYPLSNLLSWPSRCGSLPEKWHGLRDVDLRYRQRYLDLIVNPEVREVFETRSKIIRETRNFLDNKGFLEVETPMMQTIAGGCRGQALYHLHNALNISLYPAHRAGTIFKEGF